MTHDNGPLEALARDISNNFICSCEWPASDGDKCQCGGDGTDGMEGCWKCQADAALREVPAPAPGPLEVATRALEVLLAEVRSLGWAVAVHNDYRLNGEAFTFWLFTRGDRCVKGEARTDREAVAAALRGVAAPAGQPACQHPEYSTPVDAAGEFVPGPKRCTRCFALAPVAAPVPADGPTCDGLCDAIAGVPCEPRCVRKPRHSGLCRCAKHGGAIIDAAVPAMSRQGGDAPDWYDSMPDGQGHPTFPGFVRDRSSSSGWSRPLAPAETPPPEHRGPYRDPVDCRWSAAGYEVGGDLTKSCEHCAARVGMRCRDTCGGLQDWQAARAVTPTGEAP